MARLYVNQTLERQIRQYCELNEIEDINAFANRCLSQGFNIVKYGTSPSDNSEREIEVTVSEAIATGLEPCSRCQPDR